jgi:hypothetical protein
MTSLAGDVTDFVHAGGTDGSPQVIEDGEEEGREGGRTRERRVESWRMQCGSVHEACVEESSGRVTWPGY